MKKLLFALLACASTMLWGADIKSFNGTWVVESAEFNGNAVSSDALSSILLTIQDGSYRFESSDANAKGSFKADFSRTPATMDSTEVEGSNPGKTTPAIVELTAKGWRACYAFQDGSERPKEFKSESNSGHLLIAYKRKPGSEPSVSPLKVLLLAGGCCHDYGNQKDALKSGIEARINAGSISSIQPTPAPTRRFPFTAIPTTPRVMTW